MPPDKPKYAKEVIWKFPLNTMTTELMMPYGAEIVHVGNQINQVHIWALVDPRAKEEFRVFHLHGTGEPILTNNYVGTAIMQNGLVWHVFEV